MFCFSALHRPFWISRISAGKVTSSNKEATLNERGRRPWHVCANCTSLGPLFSFRAFWMFFFLFFHWDTQTLFFPPSRLDCCLAAHTIYFSPPKVKINLSLGSASIACQWESFFQKAAVEWMKTSDAAWRGLWLTNWLTDSPQRWSFTRKHIWHAGGLHRLISTSLESALHLLDEFTVIGEHFLSAAPPPNCSPALLLGKRLVCKRG